MGPVSFLQRGFNGFSSEERQKELQKHNVGRFDRRMDDRKSESKVPHHRNTNINTAPRSRKKVQIKRKNMDQFLPQPKQISPEDASYTQNKTNSKLLSGTRRAFKKKKLIKF